ncbi:MAG TPA: hypothetical protein VKQ30_20805 [Ktedonobacterales bacterium]|nr:hypothetical protein [Ktedonobacterales bacterium]
MPRKLITRHDPAPKFEIPQGQVLRGLSALVDPEHNVHLKWIKTKEDPTLPGLVEALQDAFATYKGRSKPVGVPTRTHKDLLSVYPIADQHLGLMAWGRETGESSDLELGAKRLRAVSARLLNQSPASRQALVLNLGDWTHTDDSRNETPGHRNRLDVDSRYPKIVRVGVDLFIDLIEGAKAKHERVLVKVIPGNHDPHASVALSIALEKFYANDKRVKIDSDPSEHFFLRFGQTLLGAHHGHRARAQQLVNHMSDVRRKDWGETRWHWILTGHIHHETLKEIASCRVESFQTLAAKDAYHANAGYSAGQSLSCITLHREDGELERQRVNIPPPARDAKTLEVA